MCLFILYKCGFMLRNKYGQSKMLLQKYNAQSNKLYFEFQILYFSNHMKSIITM